LKGHLVGDISHYRMHYKAL